MKRLEEHEAFEMRALRWLASKRFLGHLVMGGGTMLRLCHDLPRYSIDIEFLVRKGIEPDLGDEEKKAVLRRLRGFNKKNFNVKLGSILAPELREYYKANRFAFLEEKLSFQNWK
jgi:hypothetical protein